jgi:hypothetical protein
MSGARSALQAVGDGIEFFLAVDAEIGIPGQGLAQQVISVFASAALRWS